MTNWEAGWRMWPGMTAGGLGMMPGAWMAHPVRLTCLLAGVWIPAFAGMTKIGAGMANEGAAGWRMWAGITPGAGWRRVMDKGRGRN